MFDSVNVNSDYTFTQLEDGQLTDINSNGFSNPLGAFGMPKNSNIEDLYPKSTVASTTTSTTNSTGSTDFVKSKDADTPIYKNNSEDNETYHEKNVSYVTTSFEALLAEVGAIGGKITESQLIAYLQSLNSPSTIGIDNSEAIAFVKNLIANFSLLSKGSGYITSFAGTKDPQDYETVTTAQVTPPIDLRI